MGADQSPGELGKPPDPGQLCKGPDSGLAGSLCGQAFDRRLGWRTHPLGQGRQLRFHSKGKGETCRILKGLMRVWFKSLGLLRSVGWGGSAGRGPERGDWVG